MIKKNLWQIFGSLIGVVGILLTIFLYQKTIKERDPVLIIDPNRTEILNSEKISSSPIKVITPDGGDIESDITLIKFYFWNKGSEAIKNEHVLENLNIIIDDPLAKIIDNKLLVISREICQIKLIPSNDDSKNKLYLKFTILEQYDGFTGQIIYEGNPDAKVKIEGIIEGVKDVSSFALSNSELIEESILNILKGILVIIMFLIVYSITPQPDYDPPDTRQSEEYKNNPDFREAYDRFDSIKEKLDSDRRKKYLETKKTKKGKRRIIIFSVIFSIVVISFIISYILTKNYAEDNPSEYIPDSIVNTS